MVPREAEGVGAKDSVDSASSRAVSCPVTLGSVTPLLEQSARRSLPDWARRVPFRESPPRDSCLIPSSAQCRQPDSGCEAPPGTGGTGVPLSEPDAMGHGPGAGPKGSQRRSGRPCHLLRSSGHLF